MSVEGCSGGGTTLVVNCGGSGDGGGTDRGPPFDEDVDPTKDDAYTLGKDPTRWSQIHGTIVYSDKVLPQLSTTNAGQVGAISTPFASMYTGQLWSNTVRKLDGTTGTIGSDEAPYDEIYGDIVKAGDYVNADTVRALGADAVVVEDQDGEIMLQVERVANTTSKLVINHTADDAQLTTDATNLASQTLVPTTATQTLGTEERPWDKIYANSIEGVGPALFNVIVGQLAADIEFDDNEARTLVWSTTPETFQGQPGIDFAAARPEQGEIFCTVSGLYRVIVSYQFYAELSDKRMDFSLQTLSPPAENWVQVDFFQHVLREGDDVPNRSFYCERTRCFNFTAGQLIRLRPSSRRETSGRFIMLGIGSPSGVTRISFERLDADIGTSGGGDGGPPYSENLTNTAPSAYDVGEQVRPWKTTYSDTVRTGALRSIDTDMDAQTILPSDANQTLGTAARPWDAAYCNTVQTGLVRAIGAELASQTLVPADANQTLGTAAKPWDTVYANSIEGLEPSLFNVIVGQLAADIEFDDNAARNLVWSTTPETTQGQPGMDFASGITANGEIICTVSGLYRVVVAYQFYAELSDKRMDFAVEVAPASGGTFVQVDFFQHVLREGDDVPNRAFYCERTRYFDFTAGQAIKVRTAARRATSGRFTMLGIGSPSGVTRISFERLDAKIGASGVSGGGDGGPPYSESLTNTAASAYDIGEAARPWRTVYCDAIVGPTFAPIPVPPAEITIVSKGESNANCVFTYPSPGASASIYTASVVPFVSGAATAVYNPMVVAITQSIVTVRAEGRSAGTFDWDGTVGVLLTVFENGTPICYYKGAPNVV